MGTIRVIVGGLILAFGFLLYVGTVLENTPTPNNPLPPIPNVLEFADTMLVIIVEAVIIVIGVVILAWGIRSCQSPN